MRVLRILGNTIRRRFVTVVLATGCCLEFWKDNETWDDDCPWKEQSQSNQLPLNFPIELE